MRIIFCSNRAHPEFTYIKFTDMRSNIGAVDNNHLTNNALLCFPIGNEEVLYVQKTNEHSWIVFIFQAGVLRVVVLNHLNNGFLT